MFTPEIRTIKRVKWDGEGNVDFEFEEGFCWCGAKRKDFWGPDDDWKSKIKRGSKIRLWTVQWSTVLGFEVLVNDRWQSVWCHANDFQTKAERKKSDEGYVNFIEKEGNRIAKWIDQGKNLQEIDKLISDEHTGNTHACALNIGIRKAKNRENAEKVRKEHNKEWGVEDKKGLVNPAFMTIESK